MTWRNDEPLPRFGAPVTNSPGYITRRPVTSLFDIDSTKKPMMFATRTHFPPPGHENDADPGWPGVPAVPGIHSVFQLLASCRQTNSSKSNTAIGTMRGLNGPHAGAQLFFTRFAELSQLAFGSWLIK